MKKIPTLFLREFDNHKIVDVKPIITKGCEEAFLHGTATVKKDGSCCAIFGGKLYKRYDAKNGKPIPKGAIKCQEEGDPVTGHLPCWVECNESNPADKWFIKAAEERMKYEAKLPLDCVITFEAIGKHFNGNPYGLDFDTIVRHGDDIVEVERTFDGVKRWLTENNEEGLVFWYKGEPVCKIKRSDFGLPWGRQRNREGGK